MYPVARALLFAWIARDAAATINRAHSIPEANGICNHHCSIGCAAQITNYNRTVRSISTCVEIIFPQEHPAVADHVMWNPYLRFTTGMSDAIELQPPVCAVSHPSVNR